jgi:hypothetical protein
MLQIGKSFQLLRLVRPTVEAGMQKDDAAPYEMFPVTWLDCHDGGEPTAEGFLRFVTGHDAEHDLRSIADRYARISGLEPEILYKVPREPRLMNKLVWPLREAKASFILGNYLGVIALCGFVAEMAAILRYQIAIAAKTEGVPGKPDAQKALFGSSFERLGQERRVDVLATLGLVDEATRGRFDAIRLARRKHLHFLSETTEGMASDAEMAYGNAFAIVFDLMGHRYEGDETLLYGKLMPYLDQVGYDLDSTA